MPVIRLRVVWGRGETMASLFPTSRLSRVDFPGIGAADERDEPGFAFRLGAPKWPPNPPRLARPGIAVARLDLALWSPPTRSRPPPAARPDQPGAPAIL